MRDELCQDYDYERQSAIKLLGGILPPPSGRKRPAPALELWLPHSERHHERLNSRAQER